MAIKMENDDDDETPVLSSSALDALKEFYADRDAHQKQFQDLKAVAEQNTIASPEMKLSMEAFAEDWNESQFWYSDETAKTLAKELLDGAGQNIVIAVVSAPSVFVQLKNFLSMSEMSTDQKPKIWLLEFDRRFAVFPEFVFYDYNHPFNLPCGFHLPGYSAQKRILLIKRAASLKGTVNRIICDPPFLSEDCQTKSAMTVRWLSKSWGGTPSPQDSRLVICTGERMQGLITKLYRPQGVLTTSFEPTHSKGLSNEFFCYANFECEEWNWRTLS